MEVIIQVVEDRNYLEAQKGETKTVRMYDLQYAKREEQAAVEHQRKEHGGKKKDAPIADLGDHVPPSKEEIRQGITFDSINEKFVYRGLFNRFMRTQKKIDTLRCFEAAEFALSCPEGDFRDHLRTRLLKTFISKGAITPVTLPENLKQQLENSTADQAIEPLELLRDAMKADLVMSVDAFKYDSRFELLYDFEVEAVRSQESADFLQLRLLGQGGFGMVHAVSKTMTGALYAQKACGKMKIINKKRMLTVVNEVDALRRCQHPFIVGLHYVYADEVNIYIVLDLMLGGELGFHLKGKRKKASVIQFWTASLVLAISYMHSLDIVHRDLKPANVLMDDGGFLRITDFGLSLDTTKAGPLKSCCGTPGYIAPEMYLGPSWDLRRRSKKPSSRPRQNSIVGRVKGFARRSSMGMSLLGRPKRVSAPDVPIAIVDKLKKDLELKGGIMEKEKKENQITEDLKGGSEKALVKNGIFGDQTQPMSEEKDGKESTTTGEEEKTEGLFDAKPRLSVSRKRAQSVMIPRATLEQNMLGESRKQLDACIDEDGFPISRHNSVKEGQSTETGVGYTVGTLNSQQSRIFEEDVNESKEDCKDGSDYEYGEDGVSFRSSKLRGNEAEDGEDTDSNRKLIETGADGGSTDNSSNNNKSNMNVGEEVESSEESKERKKNTKLTPNVGETAANEVLAGEQQTEGNVGESDGSKEVEVEGKEEEGKKGEEASNAILPKREKQSQDGETENGKFQEGVKKKTEKTTEAEKGVDKKAEDNDKLGTAPEKRRRFRFPRFGPYGTSVDWWAFGVIVHQMFNYGNMPFATTRKSTTQMLKKIVQGKIDWPEEDDKNNKYKIPEEAKDLVAQLLHHDPAVRLGSCENGVEKLKAHPFFEDVDWVKLEKKLVVPPFVPRSDMVNADFQEAEWDRDGPSQKERAKSLAAMTDQDKKHMKEMIYSRKESLHNEIFECRILYSKDEEHPTDHPPPPPSSVCVIQ